MEDYLVLTVVIKGENIMSNPLLKATGVAVVKGKAQLIEKETPITSIPDFIEAFEGLFQEEKQR
ncbi:unnamed protein product [marine sediment metagenome]|uniref:Uncharacterized protein n=1 Tax=marine sediment metagenome TaxID=412755 RepID=X1VBA8_9ZZZZ